MRIEVDIQLRAGKCPELRGGYYGIAVNELIIYHYLFLNPDICGRWKFGRIVACCWKDQSVGCRLDEWY